MWFYGYKYVYSSYYFYLLENIRIHVYVPFWLCVNVMDALFKQVYQLDTPGAFINAPGHIIRFFVNKF